MAVTRASDGITRDSLGRVYTTTNAPDATSFWSNGNRFSADGHLHITTTPAAGDVYLGGRRYSNDGRLVVGPGDAAARPYFYNGGFPFDKRDGRGIVQENVVPVATDPYVVGSRVGNIGGLYTNTTANIPPESLISPRILGIPTVGVVTTYVPGAVTSAPAATVTARKWYANGVAIAGATGTTFTPTGAEYDKELIIGETWTNPGGSLEIFSLPMKVVYGAPSLFLDFLAGAPLDARVTFTRASTGTYWDSGRVMRVALANEPRFTYEPATRTAIGLLVEGPATNLNVNCNVFTAWVNSTIAQDASSIFAEPAKGWTITEGFGVGPHGAFANTVTVTAAVNTFSYYVSPGTNNLCQILCAGNITEEYANFLLQSGGTITYQSAGANAKIEQVGANTYRISISPLCSAATDNTFVVQLNDLNSIRNPVYTGSGRTLGIQYAQVELGPQASSLILTSGIPVTRQADLPVMTGVNFSSWYAQAAGTLLSTYRHDYTAANAALYCTTAHLSTGSDVGIFDAFVLNSIGPGIITRGLYLGVDKYTPLQPAVSGRSTIASTYEATKMKSSLNGSITTQNTIPAPPTLLTHMSIGTVWWGGSVLNNALEKIKYWPYALSDADLQTVSAS